MRVLITGASGFVARHMFDFLREEEPEAELYGLVRPHGTPPALPGRITIVEGDLLDGSAVDAALALAQPDRVIHLAAQSSPRQSWDEPEATLRTNIFGAFHLLEAARKLRARPRMLLVGSSEE